MRHFTFLSAAPLIVIALLFQAAPLGAQGGSSALPSDIAKELAKLNVTLEKVQALLADQLETQTLDLLLKRTQLVSSEVARFDSLLRRAQSSRGYAEDQLTSIDDQIEEQARRSLEPGEEERSEMQIRRLETRREGMVRRLRRSEAEVVELETRIARAQRKLDDWQELLDKRLGGI